LDRDEQTRLSWAKLVELYAEVPKLYQNFFEPFSIAGKKIPYTIRGPAYEGFFHRATEKLLCDFGTEIIILEKNGNTYATRSFPLEDISYVEIRTVLLDSYFKISGLTKDGGLASSSIRFNTVTDYLFTRIVEKVRLNAIGPQGTARILATKQFDHLVHINYKFMNYGRRSMLEGENFIHFILQPEIRIPIMRLLGRTYYRRIFPTHMSILTDKELIMIREETRQSDNSRYGGIWDFIPLQKITSISLRRKDRDVLGIINLPENEQEYSNSSWNKIWKFLSQFAEPINNKHPILN
jgi:hypothetical protein